MPAEVFKDKRMRNQKVYLSLVIAFATAACGGAETQYGAAGDANSNAARPAVSPAGAAANSAAPAGGAPPIASAHGARGGGDTPPGTAPGATPERPDLDTSELDARIEKAEARARAKGATDAQRRAAAEAYLARGNVFYGAQQPRLYKFALGDFRRALRYDPKSEEAAFKIAQIEDIYRSLNKPVPTNGLEQ